MATGNGRTPPIRVVVETPLRDATQAGLSAVAAGGNAIDAALAAAALLTVAYPHTCALGGDLLALVREPDGSTTFINASGRTPRAIDVESVQRTHTQMPLTGPHTVTVPGLISGWSALHAKGAELSWAQALEPSIDAAADGFPVSAGLAASLAEDWSDLAKDPGFREVFAPGGDLVKAGQTLRQPALERTLRSLASEGAEALYGSGIGEQLVAGLQSLGVPITVDDLTSHAVTEQAPLELVVDGWTVLTAPPNSQGFVLLRLLGMLQRVDPGTSDSLQQRVPARVLASAYHETAAERDRILADPEWMSDDVEALLTDAALRALLATATDRPAEPSESQARRPDGDTVAVVAADSAGRSVSLIQSVYYSFGAQLLEPTTGMVMHNRGACFSLDPRSPNTLAPRKRPAHTLTPALAERDNERLVVGTMGGEVQPQILLQVLSRLFAGATPAQSVGAPRWTVGPWDRGEPSDVLNYERDIDPQLRTEFRDWGGPLHKLPSHSSQMGHAQAIRVQGDDLLSGTDPRADALPLQR